MRSRSNSGVRLDYYHRLVTKTIISHQNPITGLLPASTVLRHAWVRDNVYGIIAVWGLALAYRKQADLDEDRAKAYELEQHVVKLMRGLLMCMMKQVKKVEAFKKSQSLNDCLHAKYSLNTGDTCVGDQEWGHMQVDATSLYLLMLAQMTASGLQIIFSLDEVAFVQNLVFYIEHSYRIPDYGIWERGDKTNHGLPELNASSIGMAKAAMEALNELDLFGARGGPASVIHVQSDMIAKCQAVLYSMLPRESNSKEIDASLLSIIGFPAFAVDDEALVNLTRQQITDKLQGRYGCRRFLRDGYKTALEDPNRKYYEPAELKVFENIECEWPLFWTYLLIEGVFHGNKEQADEYAEGLRDVLVPLTDSTKVVPELYYVPKDKVILEYSNPHSQDRVAGGKIPHIWSQSLYILGLLLQEGFIAPGEVDPLNRRMSMEPKPDLVVQVSLLAEDKLIQDLMKKRGFDIQTVVEASPVSVYPARVLTHLYKRLGANKKLGLSGNPSKEHGVLTTSKLYSVHGQILAFVPQFMDQHQFYLPLDNDLLSDISKTDVAFLHNNWREIGRPVVTIIITETMMGLRKRKRRAPSTSNYMYQQMGDEPQSTEPKWDLLPDGEHGVLGSAMWSVIRKIKSGYLNGVQVKMGHLHEFLSTSCIKHLSFLETTEQGEETTIQEYLEPHLYPTCPRPFLPPVVEGSQQSSQEQPSPIQRTRKMSVSGIVQRTRSIDLGLERSGPRSSSRGLVRRKEIPDIVEEQHEDLSPKLTSPPQETLTWFEAMKSPSKLSSKPSFHLLPEDLAASPMKRTPSWLEDEMVMDMYKGITSEDLLAQLSESLSLSDQADILHYLYVTDGLKWDTKLSKLKQQKVTVKTLMEELYYKSAHYKAWSVVRHTAGILEKKVEHLAQSVTELLTRQKQLSVGIPPEPRERIITAPLPPRELHMVIAEACGGDKSSAVLTQELLVYLSMFIRTEPKLFNEMLRIRVGLIMQVMTSELARTMGCPGDKAYEHLMTLSPYEMKDLLYHILSGKEFGVTAVSSKSTGRMERQLSIVSAQRDEMSGLSQLKRQMTAKSSSIQDIDLEEDVFQDKVGQWLRRRRLDGALNRAPAEFYHKVWKILEKCHGLSIQGYALPHHLTREMTENEFKFALQVESALNRIPQPEFRQLMVEAIMVLSLVVENDWLSNLGAVIQVEELVIEANQIFLKDQIDINGDATLCCAVKHCRPDPPTCGGVAGICCHFYDSAPSGLYGTMAYLAKAAAKKLNFQHQFQENSEVECKVS